LRVLLDGDDRNLRVSACIRIAGMNLDAGRQIAFNKVGFRSAEAPASVL
jgi:hypothetical protein